MLTLILQTQEGHQIELNVRPEDTFADLKNQYANHEVLGLLNPLEQIITNGASVAENTKIFDYVSASANEWFSADSSEDPLLSQSDEVETKLKECCARGCLNNEASAPGKPFFPLPTDRERLSARLTEIGRLDLYDRLGDPNSDDSQRYFLCDSHFNGEPSFSPVEFDPERTLSLLKSKNNRPKSDPIDGPALSRAGGVKVENPEGANDNNIEEVVLAVLDNVENYEHPGILCRLCGNFAEDPINLYAPGTDNDADEFSLADKVNLCLPVTITITDPLPKQICRECHEKLNVCHDLAISSLQAEDRLKLLLREHKLCVDVNCRSKCPLCVEGEMEFVEKSGVYRREDLKNDFIGTREKKNDVSTEENLEIIRSIETSRDESTIDELRVENSDENIRPSLPDGEFACSICASIIVDVESIKTHECRAPSEIPSRRCVICKDTNFASLRELRAHYSGHGIDDDELDTRIDERSNNEETHEALRLEATNETLNARENIFDEAERASGRPKIHYACNFCKREFTRKGSLEKHMKSLHAGDSSKDSSPNPLLYKCKACSEAFSREIEAKSHAKSRHFLSFVSDEANFAQSEFFIDRLTVTCLYVCEYCERSFTVPSALHEHRELDHPRNNKYFCPTCDLTFDSHRQLATHKTLRSHRKALDHIDVKQYYVCKYCDKTFLHNSSHSSHLAQHRDTERPYICRVCNVNFDNYRDISLHRNEAHPYRSKLHERPSLMYNCQYCNKQFGQEIALMKHIRMHTGERPYKCAICGKGFSQSSGLYTHLRIHSDLRPYGCTKCPRTFKIKGDRDNHMKKHTGNRPYKCQYCNKAFMTQHVYSQHCKIHTDERPYKCDVCGQAFRRSHVLTVHMRRHTGEKPHCCDFCPKTYRQRGDLLKHRRSQHASDVIDSNRTYESNARDDDSFDHFSKVNRFTDICGNSLMLPL